MASSSLELHNLSRPTAIITFPSSSHHSHDQTEATATTAPIQWHNQSPMDETNPPTPVDETAPASDEHGRLMASLPPVDSGRDAWLFIAACCVLEMLVWGFPFSFGVFQDYYSTHAPFADSNTAIVGTLSLGLNYLVTPITMGTIRLFPRQARWAPMAGLILMCLALVLSSLSTTVSHLIATHGILYAVGGSVCYSPCIVYLDEWFVRRRGLAYGIIMSGTGIAGVVMPLLIERLLSQQGFQMTMRLFAVIIFGAAAPLTYFIKPRLPASAATHTKPWSLRFLLSPKFALYELTNVAQAMGYFLPGIYLPIYARVVLGAGSVASALTVLLLNVASVFGSIGMGGLMDRVHPTTGVLVSTLGGAISAFLLWGMATNLAVLYVFCFVYGMLAGSFTSVWPGIMLEMSKLGTDDDERAITNTNTNTPTTDPGMVFAFLAAGRGIGNIVSGPLSDALIHADSWRGKAGLGYGSGYGGLIVFTGATAMIGGASVLWRRIGWL